MGVSLYPEAVLPPGMVMPYAGSVAPTGWLLCDGQSLLRADYPDLFAVIGTTYGLGTDTTTNTTFALPNLKGKVIVGVNTAEVEFDTLGEVGGSKNSTAFHTHSLSDHRHALEGHTHGFSTDFRNTNHAHNVYARDTNHDHAINHWHTANIGQVAFNFATAHAHHDRAGTVAEGPWEDYRAPGASVPVNVDGTAQAAPNGNNISGSMRANWSHDHPSTNYASESPWPGDYNHQHAGTTAGFGAPAGWTSPNVNSSGESTQGAAAGNLQPYMALHYLIKT